jgi:hypothetical protein
MEPQQADQQIRQLAFDFACNSADGLVLWREQRQASTRRLGAELQSGVILRGTLLLDGEDLFLSTVRESAVLRIGERIFSIGEIDSCVRID